MTLINVLDERLINKIAAGEVIERPASVVKELVENSLDASSTKIDVTIEDYGKRLIRVSDDGSGMSAEDAKLSILRHATSKIKEDNDLFRINTLGFRGEALASIAAVSHMFLTTKNDSSLEGIELEVEGGNIISCNPKGTPKGTVVEVRDLFFNTPARLKFMRSESNELKNITDIVTKYALINPHVSIKLVHNGHTLVNSPSSEDMLNNIASVYGVEIAKQLLEVEYENDFFSANGFISKPSLLKSDKGMQAIYVNGRYVKDEHISQALYDAYHTLLFVNRHPVVVLNIRLDPHVIDVNVHPTKDRIKFEENAKVYDMVFDAVRQTLQKNSLITDYSELEKDTQFGLNDLEVQSTPKKKEKNYFISDKGNSTLLNVASNVGQEETIRLENAWANKMPEERVQKTKLPEMKVLCQVMKTFFIAEVEDGLLLIDQHVVQERVMYEHFMNEYMNQNIKMQTLLYPLMIEVPPQDTIFLLNSLNEVKGLFKKFGKYNYRYYSIDYWLKELGLDLSFKGLVRLILNKPYFFEDGKEILGNLKDKVILIISSSTTNDFIEIELGNNKKYFDYVFSSIDSFNIPGKTKGFYLKVAKRLKVKPSEVLHIGDNWEMDVINAKKAGLDAFYFDKSKLRKDVIRKLRQKLKKDL